MKPQPILTVSDVNKSASFYCTLLGAKRGHTGEDYAQILFDGEMIMQLHNFDADDDHDALGDENAALGNGVVVWFETDDFDGVVRRISDAHLATDRDPAMNPYAKHMEVWLHDPDGYQVVIAGPSPYPREAID